ncbi:response regulator [Ketobacter sp. MCCC 1A13808]|uniref:response regulator n=1 Tax=Ketobacter sp. MCCC 1A13808 TaxID=2602738 RepID=UPI0012EB3B93|nr:response regulator [Ketobacter sp. MCCC 1A13808]MVF12231.1 response regulator [Ketobacter sp. MCCC 1A13808]
MNTSKVLLVDDEKNNRNSIIRLFEDSDFTFVQAEHGQDALDILETNSFDLILLDIKMPVMDGFEFLKRFANVQPRPPICIMTAFNDAETRRKAIHLGADDFINKPLDPIELETRIISLLRISRYQQELNHFNKMLESLVADRTKELRETYEKLKVTEKQNSRAYRDMITRIAKLAGYRHGSADIDPRKLSLCVAALGWICDLPVDESENLSLSALVFNIGLLSLPDKLCETPIENLNKDQMTVLLSYTIKGAEIFEGATSNLLKQAYHICLSHRENFDGSGYPYRKKGTDIPIEARLHAAAYLIVETMGRFPEQPLSHVENALRDHSGVQLDPFIVETLLSNPDTLSDLLEQLS